MYLFKQRYTWIAAANAAGSKEMDKEKNYILRKIPRVDDLLKEEDIRKLCAVYGKKEVLQAVREELDCLRKRILAEAEEGGIGKANSRMKEDAVCEKLLSAERITEQTACRLEENSALSLRKVFNATGIILHTNLGRAPLGKSQMAAVLDAMSGYSNLEYNLSEGRRGKRWEHYTGLISRITGSEGAIAVNNNAAAVTLILSTLARGKEVIVSRGELIEIGGRFRVPEVMEQSGATLRETGCTNRTRISDYERAITENTGALLKVHTSNYRILGFTEEVSVEELSSLGRKYHLPVIVDLGSGVLVNLEKFGLSHEPTVQEVLKKGADMVCFSGDKLLGGPQAGIIAGKQSYIKAMENHPLMRAFRLDKCTIAALAATFREYLNEEKACENIPVLKMLSRSEEELEAQAREVAWDLSSRNKEDEITVEKSISMLGGGSMPLEEIPSRAVVVKPKRESAEEFVHRLAALPVPIIAHIKNNRVILDMRTISEEELNDFKSYLAGACENRTHPGRC